MSPPSRPSATSPWNFDRQGEKPWSAAIRSTAMKPILWRFLAYFAAGIAEADPELHGPEIAPAAAKASGRRGGRRGGGGVRSAPGVPTGHRRAIGIRDRRRGGVAGCAGGGGGGADARGRLGDPGARGGFDAYLAWAERSAALLRELGCLEMVEAWEDGCRMGSGRTIGGRSMPARRADRLCLAGLAGQGDAGRRRGAAGGAIRGSARHRRSMPGGC